MNPVVIVIGSVVVALAVVAVMESSDPGGPVVRVESWENATVKAEVTRVVHDGASFRVTDAYLPVDVPWSSVWVDPRPNADAVVRGPGGTLSPGDRFVVGGLEPQTQYVLEFRFDDRVLWRGLVTTPAPPPPADPGDDP